ncbi:MAG: MBOAT family O-acyltransferase [Candidatus Fimivivens sp.]|nr:MBOAT family O-acyltransferase [Candidatus Fimivivens sp.]
MVFADLIFLYLFLPANLILYYISKNRTYRNLVLVLFSLFFYAWGEPIWIVLLLFSATVDYIHGLIIEQQRQKIGAKLAVVSSLVINLALLASFKYSGLIVVTVNNLFGTAFTPPSFALPIGISFYTFQTISYTIDVYRGDAQPQHNFGKFLLFVSLYHQLVAGPIVRYNEISERIEERHESWAEFSLGINRFLIGLTKKTLVANTAGKLAIPYLEGNIASLSVLGAWFGITLYALQIYYDFSGYSDMAIGLGHMFGFRHPENFRYPYISRSATEFWRRWHVSLGRFFRDYLYIPLGGNRRHMIFNLLITWFATGLWHGASWNFVLWGCYYGVLILLERLFLLNLLERLPRFISHLYFVVLMLFGWVLFNFVHLPDALLYMGRMIGLNGAPVYDLSVWLDLSSNGIWFFVSILFSLPVTVLLECIWERVPKVQQSRLGWVRPVFNVVLLIVATALLVGQSYNPFMYFRF